MKRLPIVIAPPLGGLAIERFGILRGMRAGFAVSLVLAAAMLVVLGSAFRDGRPAPSAPLTPAPSRGERVKLPLHPTLRRLLVADCLVRLCEGLPDVFLVVWALEIVRISPSRFGLLVSIMMATAILSYFPAAVLAGRLEKKPFVVATFLFFTLFPLAVVMSRDFGQLAAAFVVGGLREIGEPARKALIVDLSAFAARGRTVGLYYAIRGFAVAGAAAVGGILWTIRPSLTFYVAGALGAAGTLWTMLRVPGKISPEAVIR